MAGRPEAGKEPAVAKTPARVHVPASPWPDAGHAPDSAPRPLVCRVARPGAPRRPPVVRAPMPRAPVAGAPLGRVPPRDRAPLEVIATGGLVIAALTGRVLPPPRRPRVALVIHARKAAGAPEEGLGGERNGGGDVREGQPPLVMAGQPVAPAEPSAAGEPAGVEGGSAAGPRRGPVARPPRFCGAPPVVGPSSPEGAEGPEGPPLERRL